MKLAQKEFNNVIEFPIQKKKNAILGYMVQLSLNLICLYLANNITIDIWRSLTGH